jgi:phosphate transport system substrate-binding protein
MKLKLSAIAAGVLGIALASAGCGSTSNVGSTSSTAASGSSTASASSSGSAATTTGFGSANQALCSSAVNTKPGYPNSIGTIAGGSKTLTGAGSTFVAPMMSDWTKAYSTATGNQVTYDSIGSGGGVAQVQANTVNFGDSDTGMNAADLAKAKGPVLQIPLLLGAVVPTYNLPGIGAGLKFTGNVLGEIYAGTIKMWNDPALTALNPGVNLPDAPIAVVHRSDGSGTTGIWTDYLTKESPTWVSTLGGPSKSSGKTVAWPVGIGGKGNEGVSGVISQTQDSLGYLESDYAISQNLTFGQVENKAGKFIEPCLASIIPAVNGVTFPASLNISLTDGTDPNVYPISGTTYALVYEHQTSQATAAALVNFFGWVLSSGQDLNASLYYAPLGSALQQLSVAQLKKITVNGQPVVK